MKVGVDACQDMLSGVLGVELLFTNTFTAQFMLSYEEANNMDHVGGQVKLSMEF